MQVNGRTLILVTAVVSVALASGAWWFHYQESKRAARFWGADAAQLLIGTSNVSLLKLDDAGATGETRPVDVTQPGDVVHDLRPAQAFVADLRDGAEINLVG